MGPEQFAEYGLQGLVIAGLFFALKNLFTIGLEKIDVVMERSAEDFRRLQDEHREERTEWRMSDQKRHEETNQTIVGLTAAIDRQNDRRRGTD